ncbi:hypothetical protein BP5796_06183 [Coleophoma crateriformis]|uniref:Uncharacterized protein n=1 Tax=Coleophoma crateriformis TaxID=565419 RepID=A0A3D8RWZ5_9HELO|nr:hypothetical protein BP5796_06183 [Coleophoma crateriformis]
MATPTLIGMPEPPSNPETPTEMPGTPNSATTSLSTLSTTAIKDGHRGHALPQSDRLGLGHRSQPSSNTLEAERADRISRLAGLERVSTGRPANAANTSSAPAGGQIPGYFDAAGNPVYTTKMSTVGSASATGSVGGRTTTWASGSQRGADDDEMSMDTNYRDIDERDRYSVGASAMDEDGMSDDASLVGFGEGANSTVSGPTYSRRDLLVRAASNHTPNSSSTSATADQQRREARMMDGLTNDTSPEYVDTAATGSIPGRETAERILKERLDEGEGKRPMDSPDDGNLGKFYFEKK